MDLCFHYKSLTFPYIGNIISVYFISSERNVNFSRFCYVLYIFIRTNEVDSFFRERSYASQSWKITQDYIRDKNDTITFIEEKTCLILYNGTKYPDLVCIFLEDAEKIKKKGNRTISEYITYIWENNRRFEHKEFQVEAEYNVTSFKDHEQRKEKVLQSKSIFCENANSSLYDTSFGVQIPVISIKDFE